MQFVLKRDDLSGPEVAELLNDHLANMAEHSPEESRHALDLSGLKQPGVYFYSLWFGNELAGCGAIKDLGGAHGEVKSMKTAKKFIRQGVARTILTHLFEQARQLGMKRLSLETGSMAYFEPAHALYESFDFVPCAPFGDYQLDPHSRFFTREL